MRSGGPIASALESLSRRLTAAGGAAVMGTGIVSVGLRLDGADLASRVLLGAALLLWLALAVALPARAADEGWRTALAYGDPASLSLVAATAVVGTRLALLGWTAAGVGLLAGAAALWFCLTGEVVRRRRAPTQGSSFLLTVASESLALLAATVAFRARVGWLDDLALAPFCLGLLAYPATAINFELRQLAVGRGDHWIAGGALAISTAAAGEIALAAQRTACLAGVHGALKDAALALWCAAIIWLPALIVAELRWPRLSNDPLRWATVFPLGMYAACSFVVGRLIDASPLVQFARIWVWVGFGAWAVALGGLARAA